MLVLSKNTLDELLRAFNYLFYEKTHVDVLLAAEKILLEHELDDFHMNYLHTTHCASKQKLFFEAADISRVALLEILNTKKHEEQRAKNIARGFEDFLALLHEYYFTKNTHINFDNLIECLNLIDGDPKKLNRFGASAIGRLKNISREEI